jgi:poly(A) polymerase/tRNA nucleotidyltransferase (CCA-adding enzyme)
MLVSSSPERLRDELIKMIELARPDAAVTQMAALGLLAVLLPELEATAGVRQSPPHHEDVLAHTITVLRWLPVVEAAIWSDEEHARDGGGWQTVLYRLIAPYRQPLRLHLRRYIDGGLNGTTLLRLAALFHDCGKARTQTMDADGRIRFYEHEQVGAVMALARLTALAFSNEAIGHVRLTIENHMRPLLLATTSLPLSRRAIYRYFRASKSAGLDAALHSLADHLARYDGAGPETEWQQLCAAVGELLNSYFTAYEDVVIPTRLVDGNTLMETLGLKPGREVGRLLALIQEAQAAGEINDREGALTFAREQLQDG